MMTLKEAAALLGVTPDNLRVASFGKAPKDGWKDSDRIAK